MDMKSVRGWLCLAIFAVACYVIGDNRYLMKAQNTTLIVMLVISAGLVFLLNYGKRDAEKERVEIEDEI